MKITRVVFMNGGGVLSSSRRFSSEDFGGGEKF